MSRVFIIYSKTNRPKKLDYPKMTGEWTDYEIHQTVEKYSNEAGDFKINDEIVEIKTNIDKFINSFKDEVGVENILKKAAQAQDLSLIEQTPGTHADLTIIPEDPEEAFKVANSVHEAFEKIDPELTKGKTIEKFISDLTFEELDSYIEKQVEKRLKEKEVKDDESIK